jgi:hypothetical protein
MKRQKIQIKAKHIYLYLKKKKNYGKYKMITFK